MRMAVSLHHYRERVSQMDPTMVVPLPHQCACVADVVAQYLELRSKKASALAQEKLAELFEGMVKKW